MSNFFDFGYVKCAAVSPKLHLGKPLKNAKEIIYLSKEESNKQNLIILFPELCLTGYTCEDFFFSEEILNETRKAIELILKESVSINSFIVIGHPYQSPDGRFYNCASIIKSGKLLAMIPKSYLPSYNEFYEARYWSSGLNVNQEINDFNQKFKLAPEQLINFQNKVIFGVEICEDLWSLNPPSVNMALNGANIILNLSASNALVGKNIYRKELVNQQSARLISGYLYSSANAMESTKDVVFDGTCLASENGTLLAEGERFSFDSQSINVEFDISKLSMERRKNTTFKNANALRPVYCINIINKEDKYSLDNLNRNYDKYPFVPSNPEILLERSSEILSIQSTGLARKLLSTNNSKIIIGLSGGLDSTLALLVSIESMKKLNRPMTDIICVSMPGFGTSERTRNQAKSLAQLTGVTFQEIDITKTVLSHFDDISQDPNDYSITYENAQARERTQILLDLGNKINAILVAGSDLSELFTGWMSYGGDHLFHYGVNVSIPKTLVQHLIRYYLTNKAENQETKDILQSILDTKISPELLPLNENGSIKQSTEDTLGHYSVVDFFMFHFLKNGFSIEKIKTLANITFSEDYSKEQINLWINSNFERFKKSQFKRTMSAPGCKVGSCSLSPRGDARYPDELG